MGVLTTLPLRFSSAGKEQSNEMERTLSESVTITRKATRETTDNCHIPDRQILMVEMLLPEWSLKASKKQHLPLFLSCIPARDLLIHSRDSLIKQLQHVDI